MKKLAIFLAFCSFAFTACELETYPEDQQVLEIALENLDDFQKFELGAYSRFRAAMNNGIISSDVQADYVNGVANYTNVYGGLHTWTFTSNDYDVYDLWAYTYATIANANFALSKANAIEATLTTDEEKAIFNQIVGEMYFFRAMCHFQIVEKFCGAYDAATANNAHTGIPVMLSFDPTAMPGRSTLAEAYKAINDDIASAKELLADVTGAPNSKTITADVVTALEARVALQMKDYTTAYNAATSLINSKTYTLAATEADLKSLLVNDNGSEVIFVFYASTTELSGISGQRFVIDQYNDETCYKPDMIPTQAQLDLYADNDIRKGAYFLALDNGVCEIEGTKIATTVYLMNKYPGNPALQTTAGTKNYANALKLFRIAEMYLIAAEAGVNGGGNDAKTYLNALRTARGLAALDAVTMADVKVERCREMMFEGNRISDLKRWGDGMAARTPQSGAKDMEGNDFELIVSGANYEQLTIEAGDFRMVWPIPENEIFANQVLAPQQNPGWIH